MPLRIVEDLINRRSGRHRFTRERISSSYHSGRIQHGNLAQDSRTLKLLSFNIQVGITTQQYGHYLTRSWQHFLPSSNRQKNLDRIAHLIQDYDIVAIQEADGGSLRSGFVNQIEYLAHRAGFPWWYQQLNRNFGRFAQHSNGLLTRCHPEMLEDHKLPGLLPGRGAIAMELGQKNPLLLLVLHLSLSKRSRDLQLEYIREQIKNYEHVILMGDMNTYADQLLFNSPLSGLDLHCAAGDVHTFPSWRPNKALDHIVLSSSLHVHSYSVLDFPQSDHLPVVVEIELPEEFELNRTVPAAH